MQYLFEAARLLLPGFGCGFMIFSIVQHFAQPWWNIGLICLVLGVVINFVLVAKPSKMRVRNKVLHVMEQFMPWFTLAMVIMTLIITSTR